MDTNNEPEGVPINAIASWANIGAPGSPPKERVVPDERFTQWAKPMSLPKEMFLEWWFTAEEFSVLQLGHKATEMEDKWSIYMDEENTLHFYRSWTGHEIFRAAIQLVAADEALPAPGYTYKLQTFWYEGSTDIYTPVDDLSKTVSQLYDVFTYVLQVKPTQNVPSV